MHNLMKNFSAKKIVICILSMLLSAFLLLAGLALADTLTKQSDSSEVVGAANLIVKQGSTTLTDGAAVNKTNGNVIITATDSTSPVLIHSANLTKGETVGRVLNDYDLYSRITHYGSITRTNNIFTISRTDGNSINRLKVQLLKDEDTFLEELYWTPTLGEHIVNVPITSDVGYVKLAFNGSSYDPNIHIDVSDLPRDTYKLTFNLTSLNSPNGSFELPTGALSLLNDYDLLNKMVGVSSLTQAGNKFTTIGNNVNTAFTIRTYDDSFEVISDVFSVSSAGMYAANIPLTEETAYLDILFEGKNDPDLLINVADIPKGNYKLAINIPEFSSATASFEFPTSIGGINSITLTEVGRYAYYTEDSAGNKTSTYTITIDDGAAPTVSATANGVALGNGAYTNKDVVITVNETYCNASLYYRNTSKTSTWSTANSPAPGTAITLSEEGTYEYYAHDGALNISARSSFTIDKTAPVIAAPVSSGGTVNAAFRVTTSDLFSGLNSFSYKKSGDSYFTSVAVDSAITINYWEGDGLYEFKAVDNAGNETTYTINLLTDTWLKRGLYKEPSLSGLTYRITCEGELAWIAYQSIFAGQTFSGKTISIETDLDMSAHYWVPIGSYSKGTDFSGIVQGNNHVIYGIKSPSYGVRVSRISFIGTAKNVKIYNLRLTGIDLYGYGSTAGLVGTSNNAAEIINCFVQGRITATVYSGGLIGTCSGGRVENCGFNGEVITGNNSGMLIGDAYSTVIKNCFAYGKLDSNIDDARADGFIFNYNSKASMQSCVLNAVINGTASKRAYGDASTFDPKLWFQEPKLCGGMPLLRQFYWLGSTYGQKAIDLTGYTKIA